MCELSLFGPHPAALTPALHTVILTTALWGLSTIPFQAAQSLAVCSPFHAKSGT